MGEEPQIPGDWDPTGSGEPPAQLLRRAISHVESLLHRLEPAVEAVDDTQTAAASGVDTSPVVARTDTRADAPEVPTAADPTRFTPLPTVSSAEKAEALRITLHAHEEAHRLQSEANALRAAAASDGERMLLEARAMTDQVHIEARESATALLEAARRESQAMLDAAGAEAASIRQRAVADHDSRRAEYDALAEQERAAALDEANVIIEQAERDAERIRTAARDEGRAAAVRIAHEQVSGAVADVRRTMHSLIAQVRQALAAFDESVQFMEIASATPAETEFEAEPSPAQTMPEPVEARRPLGLLFGAQRG